MKPLVCYHKGCMDGAGAALAAYLKFGEDAEYRAVSYGDPAPISDEVAGREVFIVDFSWPRAEILRLHSATIGKLTVLDHHKSAEKEIGDLPYCVFDMTKSGAAMAWEYFHCSGLANPRNDSRLPGLIRYIQDRDLWEWKLRCSKEISSALYARGATEDFRVLKKIHEMWDAYEGDSHSLQGTRDVSSWRELRLEGEAILRVEAQMIKRCVSTAEEVVLGCPDNPLGTQRGFRGLAVSCPLLQSEVGEALAIESARRGFDPIGVVWHRNGQHGGNYRVSLRSRDYVMSDEDFKKWAALPHGRPLEERDRIRKEAPDVGAIAKQLGDKGTGGGHHKAAGFECQRLPWDNTIAEVREYIRGEWCTDDRMNDFELEEKRQADAGLLARIGATMDEIG